MNQKTKKSDEPEDKKKSDETETEKKSDKTEIEKIRWTKDKNKKHIPERKNTRRYEKGSCFIRLQKKK